MDPVQVWLTMRAGGYYHLLSWYEPTIAKVGTSDVVDVYAVPGDPLGYPYVCPFGARVIFGLRDAVPLVPNQIQLRAKDG